MSEDLQKEQHDPQYWAFIREEAQRIGSDGCTLVSEWNTDCCLEHDLVCAYGRSPRSAFALAQAGDPAYWQNAAEMSRREGDRQFRDCNLASHSRLKYTRGWLRYLGVRIGALFGIGKRKH